MPEHPRRHELGAVVGFAVALAHALLTWPLGWTLTLFAGGVAVAGVLEVLGVTLGLFEHELEPQIAGVPIPILLAWPAVIYGCYRLALLVVPAGVGAAALAAILATTYDLFADPVSVRDGLWRYPERPLSSPRFRGVPWWNFLAWFAISFVTALLTTVTA